MLAVDGFRSRGSRMISVRPPLSSVMSRSATTLTRSSGLLRTRPPPHPPPPLPPRPPPPPPIGGNVPGRRPGNGNGVGNGCRGGPIGAGGRGGLASPAVPIAVNNNLLLAQ